MKEPGSRSGCPWRPLGYLPDVFPFLWTRLERLIDIGELVASEEVLFELEKRDDQVYEWAKEPRAVMFVPIDERQQ